MPITQDRMLKLLEAGEEFEMLFNTTVELAQQALRDTKLEGKPAQQALDELVLQLVATPTRSASTVLALERQHYRLTHARNEVTKNRKQRLRQASPASSHQSSARPAPQGESLGFGPGLLTAERVARMLAEGEHASGAEPEALEFRAKPQE